MTEQKLTPEGSTVPKASIRATDGMDLESMIELMVPVLRGHGVLRAGVFGSFARGEAARNSDLDLVVELPDGSSLLDLVGLQLELEGPLGINVDVTTYNDLHPRLRKGILSEEKRII